METDFRSTARIEIERLPKKKDPIRVFFVSILRGLFREKFFHDGEEFLAVDGKVDARVFGFVLSVGVEVGDGLSVRERTFGLDVDVCGVRGKELGVAEV